MKNWLIVTTEDNFEISLKRGIVGFPATMEATAKRTSLGDRVIFYLSRRKVGQKGPCGKVSKFVAIGELAGSVFHSDDKIWNSVGDETFPTRCKAEIIVGKYRVEAKSLVDSLEFVKNKKAWGVSFFKSIREIPKDDYETISSALGL